MHYEYSIWAIIYSALALAVAGLCLARLKHMTIKQLLAYCVVGFSLSGIALYTEEDYWWQKFISSTFHTAAEQEVHLAWLHVAVLIIMLASALLAVSCMIRSEVPDCTSKQ